MHPSPLYQRIYFSGTIWTSAFLLTPDSTLVFDSARVCFAPVSFIRSFIQPSLQWLISFLPLLFETFQTISTLNAFSFNVISFNPIVPLKTRFEPFACDLTKILNVFTCRRLNIKQSEARNVPPVKKSHMKELARASFTSMSPLLREIRHVADFHIRNQHPPHSPSFKDFANSRFVLLSAPFPSLPVEILVGPAREHSSACGLYKWWFSMTSRWAVAASCGLMTATERWPRSQRPRTASNPSLCCVSLTFLTVNEGSLGWSTQAIWRHVMSAWFID